MSAAAPSRGAGPNIVPRGSPQPVLILKNVEANAVLVRKRFRRAGVGPHAGKDAGRIAEQKTKRVEMMDAHDPQRDPTLPLLPGHPVGNGPHLDRRQDGVAQLAPFQQHFKARIDWS